MAKFQYTVRWDPNRPRAIAVIQGAEALEAFLSVRTQATLHEMTITVAKLPDDPVLDTPGNYGRGMHRMLVKVQEGMRRRLMEAVTILFSKEAIDEQGFADGSTSWAAMLIVPMDTEQVETFLRSQMQYEGWMEIKEVKDEDAAH